MMTVGGPPGMFGMPPDRRPDGRISEELYMELMMLLRALVKRVEAIEKHVGLYKKPEEPCLFCNVLGTHQPWCEKNADRTSGT